MARVLSQTGSWHVGCQVDTQVGLIGTFLVTLAHEVFIFRSLGFGLHLAQVSLYLVAVGVHQLTPGA